MIPKIIHYCWFGRNPKPKLAERCIKSWKKYCKGYELIEWNEDNFNISEAPRYVQQAYEAKKWAFVTDYVRLYAMVNYGGIYMDTDVEVVKPLDKYLEHQAFSGFEDDINIPTGIMACEKGFPLFGELLHYYDEASFINNDGSLNIITNVEIITDICKQKGFVQNGMLQDIEGFVLYPKEYFCPKSYVDGVIRRTENTYTIHHFNASWLSDEHQKEKTNRWKEKQKKAKIKKFRASVKSIGLKLLGENLYKKIRNQ